MPDCSATVTEVTKREGEIGQHLRVMSSMKMDVSLSLIHI